VLVNAPGEKHRELPVSGRYRRPMSQRGREKIKPSFHYPSWRPVNSGRELG